MKSVTDEKEYNIRMTITWSDTNIRMGWSIKWETWSQPNAWVDCTTKDISACTCYDLRYHNPTPTVHVAMTTPTPISSLLLELIHSVRDPPLPLPLWLLGLRGTLCCVTMYRNSKCHTLHAGYYQFGMCIYLKLLTSTEGKRNLINTWMSTAGKWHTMSFTRKH